MSDADVGRLIREITTGLRPDLTLSIFCGDGSSVVRIYLREPSFDRVIIGEEGDDLREILGRVNERIARRKKADFEREANARKPAAENGDGDSP